MYLVNGKHNKQSYATSGPPEEYRNNATAQEMNTNAAYGQIQYSPDEPTYY